MAERLISERLVRVPRGRHLLSADVVAQHQRSRILLATIDLVAEAGYGRLTIEGIAKRARVALTTFYEHFADKEECLLAAFDDSVEAAAAVIEESIDPSAPWPRQLEAGIRAFLELVEGEPERARACLIESRAVASGLARYQALLERIAGYLDSGRQLSSEPTVLPDDLSVAAAGGLAWLVERRIAEGRDEGLVALLPEMLRTVLTLYVGVEEAGALTDELMTTTAEGESVAGQA